MVGSYPMPSWLGRRTAEPHGVGVIWNLSADQLLEGQRDAILLALHDQETAGLDVVTDGEQSRAGYVTHLTSRLDGFDYQTLGHKWKSGGRRRAEVGRVVGPVRWRQPVMADDVRYLRAHTDRAVKIQLHGPMTIVDSTLDMHYGDERALALDLAAAINAEAHALAAAGCDVIQIDEPAFSRYPERLEAWGIEALDRCLAGLPCATAVHVCYSYPLPGVPRPVLDSYAAILPMLARSSVGALALEFEEPALDPAVLARAGDKAIVFGAISICRDAVEAPAHVASRLEEALRHVAPERLMVAPDCGLLYLPREIARAKLAAMVEGARIVRRRLGVAGAAR
jgi:5-methyltetrahydropteroyltriglutamate--homocysteine methyltransferase